ncbi:MAG: hypothetical protein FJY97_05600 [candidate division Zixibacteria bacterium]|nr:hypothetical protein [candidate division Zixibacteria bacterium]
MKSSSSRWTPTGWHRLYLETPEDWSIGAISGDATTGYLRLDDAVMPRVEVRWEPVKGQEPLDRIVARYLEKLTEKNRKKKTPPLKVRRGLNLIKDEAVLQTRAIEGFHWETESEDAVQAYGALWRCSVCNRIVFAQVLGLDRESIFSTATRVLNTLRDHPEGDTVVWALYGMKFETPATWSLKEHRLLTGRILLRFTGPDGEIEVERLSLAEMQLNGRPFETWFEQTCDGDIDRRDSLSEAEFSHPGLWYFGTAIDPATVHKRLGWLPGRRPKKHGFERYGWHCAPGNKLFSLRRPGERPTPEALLNVARTLTCHR